MDLANAPEPCSQHNLIVRRSETAKLSDVSRERDLVIATTDKDSRTCHCNVFIDTGANVNNVL